ncbi:unnamed protein product [Brassica oleracea var. botrytis]
MFWDLADKEENTTLPSFEFCNCYKVANLTETILNPKPHKEVGRTRQSEATYLPVDLVSDILLRLPAKSAAKFRCVSKVWSSITTQPSFITSFTARSIPHLLILLEKNGKLFGFSIPQNQNLDSKPQQQAEIYAMTYPENRSLF